MNARQRAFLTTVFPLLMLSGALGMISGVLSRGGNPPGAVILALAGIAAAVVAMVQLVRWALKYPSN